ncbi:RimJ/RimL family protein N-acetyltransferase [Microvirga lupini]|uniref:RimJ/RimL family protein N-acetyltransferase n=1 Tax=Microvirga lupini TaxID=420324 RepID=A0A7W4VGU9_9HYPH|nr:GNAT family N-acetyltransferase [Microvirga lupini]MBB3016968.1 RimJ/RimL family protein N-acetyltransferase [Microvirga lupini]
MEIPVLAGERLRFHPWAAEDFPLLAELHADPEVQHFLQMGDPPWDEAFLRAKFEGFRADYAAHGWTKFKVLNIQGRFLGRAGFGCFDETGELELGYSFMRPFWGHGYASEAARALLDWVYRSVSVDHVIGFAVADNTASRRVLEKAGMRFTGLRDLHGIPNAFYRHERPA